MYFVRKKVNKSGTTSVYVVEKTKIHSCDSKEKYKYLYQTIGISSDSDEIASFCLRAKQTIENYKLATPNLFTELEQKANLRREQAEIHQFFDRIENVLLNGVELILDKVYSRIGFNKINDDILRQLVISRICQPSSKSGTVDYLLHYFDQDVNLSKIYRYLDKLNDSQKERVQQISIDHTKTILGGNICVIFYDVTTLYFESDKGDDLRISGFSKDGKHSQPQILLGLLVSKGGYPLAYSIHKGNQFEGSTMLPVVNSFVKKFKLDDFVIVADSGLMNSDNICELEKNNYKYIIGARIKNESEKIKAWILSLNKINGAFYELKKGDNRRLIVGYSESRAKKDKYNREKGVRRLEKAYKRGYLSKENINKRGYNKFLEIEKDVEVKIDRTKIEKDIKWDGLKGYITNTMLSGSDIYDQYKDLWQIERAFRITKGKMEMRPVFHFTRERIEAHICICFIAYKCYKELDRLMKLNKMTISIDKALFIAGAVTTIVIKTAKNKTIKKTMLMKRHQIIAPLFEDKFWNI
jgi:transposase